MWTPVKSLVLFSVYYPTGLMSVEKVTMDPEAIVAVGWLVFQYMSGALSGCAAAVSEG